MTFASSLVLCASLVVATGCAGSAARPVQNPQASAERPNHDRAGETVELRHIYLLSPGPNAKLVVTRSDVATPSQEQ